METKIILLIGIGIIFFVLFISIYNKLTIKRNQIENAKSSLDALFIKRSELIPNLISVVKQYMSFEQNTLNQITQLRTQNSVSNEYMKDNDQSIQMKQLLLNVENYPELKASSQFTDLQYSFNECDEQISAGRRFLSSSITDYNNQVNVFPASIIAAIFGFKIHEWERANSMQRQNVDAEKIFE